MSSIVQISQIQVRRGLNQDLPQLASGELGWSVDTQQLYIGNGTLQEGAPALGVTQIQTTPQAASLVANVTSLQNTVGITKANTLTGPSSGTVTAITANNAIISYTLGQGVKQRTGTIKLERNSTTASYEEDYSETAATDLVFSFDASTGTQINVNYTTTTTTSLLYRILTLP